MVRSISITGHNHGSLSLSVAFSPDGRTLASGDIDNIVRLWDVETGRSLHELIGHTDGSRHTSGIFSVLFSPDGRTLASGGDDDTIRLWNVNTGKHLHTFTGHLAGNAAFSLDGRTLASTDTESSIRLWDVKTGKHLRTLMGHTMGSIASYLVLMVGHSQVGVGTRRFVCGMPERADTYKRLKAYG